MTPSWAQAKASIPWTGEGCCAFGADNGLLLVKQLTTLPPPLLIDYRGPDNGHCIGTHAVSYKRGTLSDHGQSYVRLSCSVLRSSPSPRFGSNPTMEFCFVEGRYKYLS